MKIDIEKTLVRVLVFFLNYCCCLMMIVLMIDGLVRIGGVWLKLRQLTTYSVVVIAVVAAVYVCIRSGL